MKKGDLHKFRRYYVAVYDIIRDTHNGTFKSRYLPEVHKEIEAYRNRLHPDNRYLFDRAKKQMFSDADILSKERGD